MHNNIWHVIAFSDGGAAVAIDVDAELARLADRNETERLMALTYLGERWTMHPRYTHPAHHATTHRTSAVLEKFIAARQAALI